MTSILYVGLDVHTTNYTMVLVAKRGLIVWKYFYPEESSSV